MNEEIRKAAQDALAVQDACNLSGVVHAFSRAMTAVRAASSGTDEANTHPVAVLFADKIMDLVGRPGMDNFGEAYTACQNLAK